MSFIKASLSALGKLAIVAVLAATFLGGMVGVVYLSLRGEEVKVPEVVGKDFYETEKLIADLGLKIKKRATRFSEERPNTILEQLPRPGDTVKTGQTILVVISEANPEKDEAPATIKKETADTPEEESTDPETNKPVKANKNSNVKKPAQTTRDVISNKSNKNANTNSSNSDSNSNKSSDTNKGTGNKNSSTTPGNKPAPSEKPTPAKPNATEPPTAAKTPSGGDTRNRRVP